MVNTNIRNKQTADNYNIIPNGTKILFGLSQEGKVGMDLYFL